jgi:hypothetical protein
MFARLMSLLAGVGDDSQEVAAAAASSTSEVLGRRTSSTG